MQQKFGNFEDMSEMALQVTCCALSLCVTIVGDAVWVYCHVLGRLPRGHRVGFSEQRDRNSNRRPQVGCGLWHQFLAAVGEVCAAADASKTMAPSCERTGHVELCVALQIA